MNNKLQLFNFEGNQVRTLKIDDEPYFVGKDVAKILGYKNTKDALAKHVEVEDKLGSQIATSGQRREMTIINESGLYSLILSSKLPNAKRFKHWVTSEVLPVIRKHGAYMTPEKIEEVLLNPDTIIKLAKELKSERENRLIVEKKVIEYEPKALFADAVAASEDNIPIGQLAGFLKQNGCDIGRNRLFKWLREHHYLCTKGDRHNLPTQRAMDLDLFKVKERVLNNPDGSSQITVTTKVTGKGQQYFINKFLS